MGFLAFLAFVKMVFGRRSLMGIDPAPLNLPKKTNYKPVF